MFSSILWRALERAARRNRDHPVIVFGDSRVSYGEFAERVKRISFALWDLGIRPGDRVAFLGPNRPEYLELLFAASNICAALVPINSRYGSSDLADSLRRSGAKVLFFTCQFRKRDYLQLVEAITGGVEPARVRRADALPGLERVICFDPDPGLGLTSYDDLLNRSEELSTPFLEKNPAARPGLMVFTSGSSGLPKAVMLTQAQLLTATSRVRDRQGISSADRVLSFLPYFHVFGGVLNTLVPVMAGGTIVMLDAFDAVQSLAAVERHRCTVIYSVAPCYRAWLDHPRFGEFDLSSIRTGLCAAGSPASSATALRVRNAICPMHSHFGMTETTGVATMTSPGDPVELAAQTAGSALPGVDVAIMEPDGTERLPVECEGEIAVRGDVVIGRYFGQAAASATGLDGWLRTGDRGWIGKDGYLRVIGRLDDRLRSGGENIDPREVEQFVSTHPGIAQCHVVGVPDSRLGEIPVAFVLARPDIARPTEEDIDAFCRGRIADFKIPRRIFFVTEVPGWLHKVQRFKLQEEALARMGLAPDIHAERLDGPPANRLIR